MKQAAYLTILLAIFAGPAGAQHAKPDKQQDERTRRREELKQQRIGVLVEHIRKADGIVAARNAVRRSRFIDPDNVAILDAYVRKALQLGRPGYAVDAATELARVQPKHSLAWAVLAYDAANDRRMTRALRYTLLALEADADNAGVLHNAGQILAWYDNQPVAPELPNALLARMLAVRDKIDETPAFTRSYQRFMALYERQTEMGERLAQQVQRDRKQMQILQGRLLTARQEQARIHEQISQLELREDALRLELKLTDHYPTAISKLYDPHTLGRTLYTGTSGSIAYIRGVLTVGTERHAGRTIIIGDDDDLDDLFVNSLQAERYRRRALRDAIDRVDDRGDRLRHASRAWSRDVSQISRQIRRLESEIQQAEELINNPAQAVQRRLAWKPPAVQGEIIPPSEKGVQIAPVQRIELPTDPELEAGKLLRLARLYRSNGYPDQAAVRLRTLLEKYPKTRAAEKARKLLGPRQP
jgi:predicted nuclease with TOPRIM domain